MKLYRKAARSNRPNSLSRLGRFKTYDNCHGSYAKKSIIYKKKRQLLIQYLRMRTAIAPFPRPSALLQRMLGVRVCVYVWERLKSIIILFLKIANDYSLMWLSKVKRKLKIDLKNKQKKKKNKNRTSWKSKYLSILFEIQWFPFRSVIVLYSCCSCWYLLLRCCSFYIAFIFHK